MRPLTLHASALNDEEYQVYTASLQDLAWTEDGRDVVRDDTYYEEIRITLREMRGWLRGRYPEIPTGTTDSILRFFSPELNQVQIMSGGQVLAAMRLVTHVQNGKEVERSLGFVQAFPKQSPSSSNNPFVIKAPPFDSPVRLPPLPPRKFPPPRHNSALVPPPGLKSTSPSRTPSVPFISPCASAGPTPPSVPSKQPTHVTSTLMKQSLQASKIGQTMKRAEELLEQERVLQILKTSSVVSGGYSLAGASISRSSITIGTSVDNRNRSSSPPRPALSSGSDDSARAPPLPKRRVSPPASVSSLEQVALASMTPHPPFLGRHTTTTSRPLPDPAAYTYPRPPRPVPPSTTTTTKRPSSHHPSPVRAHSELPGVDTSLYNTTSPSLRPGSPQRSPRRPYAQLPSTIVNTAIPPHPPLAALTMTAKASHPQTSPTRAYSDLPGTNTVPRGPPPTHPGRKPVHLIHSPPPTSHSHSHPTSSTLAPPSPSSDVTLSPNPVSTAESSPTSRVFRSKSLHYPSPSPSPSGHSLPVVPPSRRKRPESVQVLPNRGAGGFDAGFPGGGDQEGGGALPPSISRQSSLSRPPVHRRSSLSVSSTPNSQHGLGHGESITTMGSPLTKIALSLQPKFEALHLQPRLEKARYKAEAGLSKRGYFKGVGGEGLLSAAEMPDEDGHEGRDGRTASSRVGARRQEWEDRGRRIDWTRGKMDLDPPGVDRPGSDGDDSPGFDSDAGRELRAGLGGDESEDERETELRRWGRETRERWGGKERDALKWPVGEGEGWRRL